MMTGSEERQAELVEQGAGNAVADLKAGFGEAAAPQFPAAEVAGNFQMAADAGALPVVEQGDGFYWMERARRAETRLRDVSRLVAELERLLKGIGEGVKYE